MAESAIYIMISHDKIENNSDKHGFMIDTNLDYDLCDARTKEVIKTVKGSTIVRNAKEGKYKVINMSGTFKSYNYNPDADKLIIHTLGIADFRGSDAKITDKGLNGIQFIAKKIDKNKLAIGVNGKVIDFQYETVPTYPNKSGNRMICEDNILIVTCGNNLILKTSIGYKAKIETIELRKQGEKYNLTLNIQDEEYGYNNGKSTLKIPLN